MNTGFQKFRAIIKIRADAICCNSCIHISTVLSNQSVSHSIIVSNSSPNAIFSAKTHQHVIASGWGWLPLSKNPTRSRIFGPRYSSFFRAKLPLPPKILTPYAYDNEYGIYMHRCETGRKSENQALDSADLTCAQVKNRCKHRPQFVRI